MFVPSLSWQNDAFLYINGAKSGVSHLPQSPIKLKICQRLRLLRVREAAVLLHKTSGFLHIFLCLSRACPGKHTGLGSYEMAQTTYMRFRTGHVAAATRHHP